MVVPAYPKRLIMPICYPETRGGEIFVDGRSAPGYIDTRSAGPHVVREGFRTLFHSTAGATIGSSSGEAALIGGQDRQGEIAATQYHFCGAVIGPTPNPMRFAAMV
jgi:hypothetical protein